MPPLSGNGVSEFHEELGDGVAGPNSGRDNLALAIRIIRTLCAGITDGEKGLIRFSEDANATEAARLGVALGELESLLTRPSRGRVFTKAAGLATRIQAALLLLKRWVEDEKLSALLVDNPPGGKRRWIKHARALIDFYEPETLVARVSQLS